MPQPEKPVIPPLEVPHDVPYARALSGDSKRSLLAIVLAMAVVGGFFFGYVAWTFHQIVEDGYFERGSVNEHGEVEF